MEWRKGKFRVDWVSDFDMCRWKGLGLKYWLERERFNKRGNDGKTTG